ASQPCTVESCINYINDLSLLWAPVANPTGYCWDVTALAANGKESAPSVGPSIHYILDSDLQPSPGVNIGDIMRNLTSAPLPFDTYGRDSYGRDVTLRWNTFPNAYGYMVKLGNWPWNKPVVPIDPANCVPANGLSCAFEPASVTVHDQLVVGANFLTVPGA